MAVSIVGECLEVNKSIQLPKQTTCTRCHHVSSQAVCKACVLLEGLNKGKPKLGIGKSNKVTARMKDNPDNLIDSDAAHALSKLSVDATSSIQDTDSITDHKRNISCQTNGQIKHIDDTRRGLSAQCTNDDGTVQPQVNEIPESSPSLLSRDVSSSAGAGDAPKDRCRGSTVTSIEDIGSNSTVCSSGGVCSNNCSNKTTKVRKVISLKKNTDAALLAAGISKKDLEF